jgi:hypothetical protein
MTETKTYPDGSQRVGCPPFPQYSPLQEAEAKLKGVTLPQEVKSDKTEIKKAK